MSSRRRVDRAALLGEIAVFPPTGEETVLLDRTTVMFSVRRRTAACTRPPHELRTTEDVGLGYRKRLKHARSHGRWSVHWDRNSEHFELQVDTYPRNGLYGIKLHVTFNPLRRIRLRLTPAEEAEHRGPPDAKDNVVEPRAVAPEIVHARVVRLIPRLVRMQRAAFRRILRTQFDAQVAPEAVAITATQMELAWDRACNAPATALHAFTPAWLGTMPIARNRYVIGEEAGEPYMELWGIGVLKGHFRNGWNLKLYSAGSHVLRYECQLTSPLVRTVLGRRLRLTDQRALRGDLCTLANHVYPPMWDVQQSLDLTAVPNAAELLTALLPTQSHPLGLHIANQLLAFGQVRCHRGTPSVYKVLCRMRDRGLVRPVSPGYWGPEPGFAALLQALVRQCRVLAGKKKP